MAIAMRLKGMRRFVGVAFKVNAWAREMGLPDFYTHPRQYNDDYQTIEVKTNKVPFGVQFKVAYKTGTSDEKISETPFVVPFS